MVEKHRTGADGGKESSAQSVPSFPGVPCVPNYTDQCNGHVVGHRVLASWFLIPLGETHAAPQTASSWEICVP